ncbi:MAG: chemotaxis protein CheA [Gammaproteobacteria bacterium]|nr:chemotaxis protein CheA [Gammaproteobacteria bacterium]
MALDADDEILQDFLVEASEILEKLNEQLVELEQNANDGDLLNAIFRGFHTIKGGAGFLNLNALVNVCHQAEDIFNLLRSGQKTLTPTIMDTFLQVLDVLNEQFDSLRVLEEPREAPAELLQELKRINHPGDDEPEPVSATPSPAPAPEPIAAAPAPVAANPADAPSAAAAEGDITDEEFEALLDALDSGAASPASAASVPAAASDEITEDEFEALLDQLHGKGRFDPNAVAKTEQSSPVSPANAPAESDAAASDEITEEEFEALLDQLHGKGQFNPEVVHTDAPATKPEAPKPEAPKPEAPKPAEAVPRAALAEEGEARKKPEAPQAETTVRVDTKRLDDIMNMVGELVLVRNRLATLSHGDTKTEMSHEEMTKAVANLDVVTGDLQMAVMKTRMQPIKKVFGRFPRVVRDLARSLKKDVNLEMVGEDTDLDKNLVEALADPLVHLVRNSVDHGIEMPDVREAAGKPRAGTVRLAAEQEGDHILLTITDDGAGMDPVKLRQIAVNKGMMDEEAAARLDDREAFMLIFGAGFSTKTEISDISGRGVGMDVVKTRIAQLNGSIEIDSELGRGTTLSIKVPLTLAIMPTLMIKLAKQTFALPLVSVNEIFHLDLTKTNVVDGQRVVMIRDHALPLYYLTGLLVEGVSRALPKQGHVVIVQVGTQQVGFVVDQLIGQEEVVIKPLGALLHGTHGMAGATITGDGKIALILDVPSLMKYYANR